jgi:hypothetical protein
VPLQAGRIAEDGGSVRMNDMSMKLCVLVAGVLVGGNRLTGAAVPSPAASTRPSWANVAWLRR